MPVSKHNQWKRQKNGLMKLVRSHSDWLEERRQVKTRKRNDTIRDTQWWEKGTNTKSVPSNKGVTSSAKRTQIGKKI